MEMYLIVQGVSVNRAILQHFFPSSATLERKSLSPFFSQLQSILVAMEQWTDAQPAFAMKAFYKNGDILVIASA
jgi:Na+-translocating ferredoxin:NAD+ oxidoreductase RnfD subunit